MSKYFAVGELGPFSSTSFHQAFVPGADAHVIRHEVDDVQQIAGFERGGEFRVRRRAAKLLG